MVNLFYKTLPLSKVSGSTCPFQSIWNYSRANRKIRPFVFRYHRAIWDPQNAQRCVEVMIPLLEIEKMKSFLGFLVTSDEKKWIFSIDRSKRTVCMRRGITLTVSRKGSLFVFIGATTVSFPTSSPSSMQMSTIARTGALWSDAGVYFQKIIYCW